MFVNRIVLEPMGIHSHRLVNADGSFTEDGIAYYETIAKGGTGLIITSAMPVNSAFDLSKGSKAAMDLAGEEFIENTKKLTERLHRYGAKSFMQLSAVSCSCPPVRAGYSRVSLRTVNRLLPVTDCPTSGIRPSPIGH